MFRGVRKLLLADAIGVLSALLAGPVLAPLVPVHVAADPERGVLAPAPLACVVNCFVDAPLVAHKLQPLLTAL
eukprot:6622699-Pyramimonas_sp.AAC.2